MTALNESVLVLNKHYMANGVTDVKRAFCLVFRGAAEIIDVDEGKFSNHNFESWQELSEFKAEFEKDSYSWIKCVANILAIPKIIRLISYGEFRHRDAKLNRRNLFTRDKNTCQYCGRKMKVSELSIDHVVPKSRGGKLEWPNVVCACVKCNVKKSNRTPNEANMKLIRKPFKPKHQVSIPRMHRSWKHFVDAAYWNVELRE